MTITRIRFSSGDITSVVDRDTISPITYDEGIIIITRFEILEEKTSEKCEDLHFQKASTRALALK